MKKTIWTRIGSAALMLSLILGLMPGVSLVAKAEDQGVTIKLSDGGSNNGLTVYSVNYSEGSSTIKSALTSSSSDVSTSNDKKSIYLVVGDATIDGNLSGTLSATTVKGVRYTDGNKSVKFTINKGTETISPTVTYSNGLFTLSLSDDKTFSEADSVSVVVEYLEYPVSYPEKAISETKEQFTKAEYYDEDTLAKGRKNWEASEAIHFVKRGSTNDKLDTTTNFPFALTVDDTLDATGIKVTITQTGDTALTATTSSSEQGVYRFENNSISRGQKITVSGVKPTYTVSVDDNSKSLIGIYNADNSDFEDKRVTEGSNVTVKIKTLNRVVADPDLNNKLKLTYKEGNGQSETVSDFNIGEYKNVTISNVKDNITFSVEGLVIAKPVILPSDSRVTFLDSNEQPLTNNTVYIYKDDEGATFIAKLNPGYGYKNTTTMALTFFDSNGVELKDEGTTPIIKQNPNDGTTNLAKQTYNIKTLPSNATRFTFLDEVEGITTTGPVVTADPPANVESGSGTTWRVTAPETYNGRKFTGWETDPRNASISTPTKSGTLMRSTVTLSGSSVNVKAVYETLRAVTVTGGKGTASPASAVTDEEVTIEANAPATGEYFTGWKAVTPTTLIFTNANERKTTFKMPSSGTVEVEPTYGTEFSVKVTGGKSYDTPSSGTAKETEKFKPKDIVTIKADTPTGGKRFSEWKVTPSTVTLKDKNAAETTFEMPEANVEVEAVFEDGYTVKVVNAAGTEIGYATKTEKGAASTAQTAFEKGDRVYIQFTSGAPDRFDRFTATYGTNGVIGITNPTATDGTAYFTMPEENVTVTAEVVARGYTVTVNNGKAYGKKSGSTVWEERKVFAPSEQVYLETTGTSNGTSFSGWSVNSPTTGSNAVTIYKADTVRTANFIMPSENVTVTANYVNGYSLAVGRGKITAAGVTATSYSTGRGQFAVVPAGTSVTITSDPDAGTTFGGWQLNPSNLSPTSGNTSSATFTFTMPSANVTIAGIGVTGGSGNTPGFIDSPSAWAQEAVNWAIQNKIINGEKLANGQLRIAGTRSVRRDEFAQMLNNYRNNPNPAAYTRFTDVPSTGWSAKAVNWLAEQQFTNGTSIPSTGPIFAPANGVARYEAVMVLYAMAGKPAVSAGNPFTDVYNSNGFYDAVRWAYQNNIVQGVGNNRFNPGGVVTREQMAQILYNCSRYNAVSR